MALKYMEKNPVSVLVGKTNKGSLIFKEGVTNTKVTIITGWIRTSDKSVRNWLIEK